MNDNIAKALIYGGPLVGRAVYKGAVMAACTSLGLISHNTEASMRIGLRHALRNNNASKRRQDEAWEIYETENDLNAALLHLLYLDELI